MSALILAFASKQAKPQPPAGEVPADLPRRGAEIVIFPGVRYERMEEPKPVAPKRRRSAGAKAAAGRGPAH